MPSSPEPSAEQPSAEQPSAAQPLGGASRRAPGGRSLAAVLEDTEAGLDLAGLLAPVVLADADDATVVEVVAGWERVASWVAAAQAAAIAELGRRAVGAAPEFVADEVAARLRLSSRAAQHLVRRAEGLAVLPEVHDLLSTGELDARRVDVVVRETDHLSTADARAVALAVLDRAPEQTGPQLRTALRRAEVTRDPGTAHVRHAKARAERCVRLTPAPDAMAWVTAFLPATDATTVMTAVDALAAAAAPEDERSLAARRADALTDVLRHVLDTGVGPSGPLPERQHRRPHLRLTLSAGGLGAEAGGIALDPVGVAELAGYGPIPLPVAQEVAAEATWHAIGIDPRTGEATTRSSRGYRPSRRLATTVIERDVTCTFPGCRIPAERCDIDHANPFDPTADPADQTREDNLAALCRHHHRLKTHGGWSLARDPATGVTVWTSAAGLTYTRDPVPADPEWEPPPRRRRASRPTIDPASVDVAPPGAFEAFLRARTERNATGADDGAPSSTHAATPPSGTAPPASRPSGTAPPASPHSDAALPTTRPSGTAPPASPHSDAALPTTRPKATPSTGAPHQASSPADNTHPGRTHPGRTHPGRNRPDDTHPGSTHPGSNRPDDTHPGSTHPGSTHPGSTRSGRPRPGEPPF